MTVWAMQAPDQAAVLGLLQPDRQRDQLASGGPELAPHPGPRRRPARDRRRRRPARGPPQRRLNLQLQ